MSPGRDAAGCGGNSSLADSLRRDAAGLRATMQATFYSNTTSFMHDKTVLESCDSGASCLPCMIASAPLLLCITDSH